jgi:hypothetical protein
MTEIDYEARVQRGIALLDEKMPGWEDRIDVSALNISSAMHCVTAQLSDVHSYVKGMEMLGLQDSWESDGSYTQHGFSAENSFADGLPEGYDQAEAFQILTEIWMREIAARQDAS